MRHETFLLEHALETETFKTFAEGVEQSYERIGVGVPIVNVGVLHVAERVSYREVRACQRAHSSHEAHCRLEKFHYPRGVGGAVNIFDGANDRWVKNFQIFYFAVFAEMDNIFAGVARLDFLHNIAKFANSRVECKLLNRLIAFGAAQGGVGVLRQRLPNVVGVALTASFRL